MDEVKLPDNPQAQTQGFKILRAVPRPNSISGYLPYIIILLIVSVGIFSGLVMSSRSKFQKQAASAINEEDLPQEVKESFNQTFRDEAEGTIEKNDDLEKYAQGTHRLIRPGGENQTAYLTSSVLDLDEYVGKKVKVYGETFGSSQVSWLMDVGKVEEIK